ncbi:hypothetical protein [Nocardioides sp. GCM10030258]|uniref:hypothetical protein n=1 Tax=unclassified Nocardioides TaxID=2615069 RepID=UPI003611CD60
MSDDDYRNEEPWFLSDDEVTTRVRLIMAFAIRNTWEWKVKPHGILLRHPETNLQSFLSASSIVANSWRVLESTLWLFWEEATANEKTPSQERPRATKAKGNAESTPDSAPTIRIGSVQEIDWHLEFARVAYNSNSWMYNSNGRNIAGSSG